MPNFFIERPIFAWVIAILITIMVLELRVPQHGVHDAGEMELVLADALDVLELRRRHWTANASAE